MATLVQQPELAQVQISNLQATQRPPETELGLSDFAVGVLGAGAKFLDQYDEDNKTRLIALGASDYMNEYTREVSILERKNYQQGRDFSEVVSSQTQRRQTFAQELQRMVQDPTMTEDQIFDANKEFLQSTVNDIYASGLDSDLKEKLYEETLKENMQYQKMIGEGLQAAALDRYTGTARLIAAKTVTDLASVARTPTEQVEYIMSQFELIKQGATQSGYAKNEEEANTAATTTLKGALDFWFKSIDPKAPDAAASLNQLRDIGENLFTAGQYELAGDIVQKVNDVQGKVLSSNDDMLVRDLTLDLHNYDVGAISFTPEEISTKFGELQQTGMYSDATLNTWYSKYLDSYQRKQEKLLQGDDEIDPMSYPDYFQYEFNNEGKGRDKWIGAAVAQAARDAQAQGLNTYTAIANNLIARQVTASTYMPELLDRAAELATTELAQWMGMSDDQIRETGGYEAYKASWNGLVQSYQALKNSNNTVGAERFLASIDSKHFPNKEVLRGLLETGAPLNSAKDALRDPIGTTRQLELVDKARNSLNLETAKLDRFWTTGHNGTWFNRTSEEVRENTLEAMKTHATRYGSLLATHMTSGSAANLMTAMEKSNLMISTKGTPVFVDPTTGARINSGQLRDASGKVVAKDYFARAIDAQREVLAKNMGNKTDPNNIVVQQNGDALYLLIHDKDGNLLNNTGSFGRQGTQLSMSGLVQVAASIRDQDAKVAREKLTTITPPKEKFKPLANIGFGTAAGSLASGDYRDTFVVKRDAVIHKGTLRLHGSNKRVAVNYPASMAIPFGGNTDIASGFIDFLNTHEAWVSAATHSKAQAGTTSKSQTVIGHGIIKRDHPEVFAKMAAAKGDQERLNIQSEYQAKFFSENNLAGNIAKAGLPPLSTGAVPSTYRNAYVLLAESTWHGGGGGASQVATALKQPNFQAALKVLEKSSVYNAVKSDRTGKHADHPRNQWRINTLRQYYNSKALASGSSINLGGRTVKPVGNTFVPYRLK